MPASDPDGAPAPAGIPNFAWVEEHRLARGRQPALALPAYRELQDLGFSAVLSLRPAREYPDDERRRYDAADERALCEALGLTFHHVACTDFQAPHPSEVVRALSALHREIGQGNAVYVHCFAGVGRTGVVSAAWQMFRGTSGTEAVRQYAEFCQGSWRRLLALRSSADPTTGPAPQPAPASSPFANLRSPHDYFHAIGAHHQAWALLTIAEVLGLPAEPPPDFIRPQRPTNGKTWRRRFRDQLQRHLGPASVRTHQ